MSEINPELRKEYAKNLISDFGLNIDDVYFSDQAHRIEFIESLSAGDMLDILRHINGRMLGLAPRERQNSQDTGGYLPLLGTPSAADKPVAFDAGYNEIKQYLATSSDTDKEKLRGVAMAIEALIIWVHPFSDGNGRTSRFIAKFIEDGTADIDELIQHTADKNNRLRMYESWLRVDQYNVFLGQDIILDDHERDEINKTKMPASEGIALSIKRLLDNKSAQKTVELNADMLRERLAQFAIKKAS